MLLVLMKGCCLNAQEGYRSLFFKDTINAVQYRVTVGIFNNQKLIINLRFDCLHVRNCQIICPLVM